MNLSPRLYLPLLAFVLFFNCSPKTEQNENSSSSPDSTAVPLDQEDIGVTGDFDGDGTVENVLIRLLNDEGSDPDGSFSYSVEFSNPKLTAIEISPLMSEGYVILNEGNVNGKPGDELSIVVCNMDNVAGLSLYGFDGKDWTSVAEPVNVVCTLPEKIEWDDVLVKTDSGVYASEFELVSYDSITYKTKEVILSSASGDFDGNGKSENVYIKTIHDAGIDDSGYWEYSIVFSDPQIPSLTIENHEAGGCEVDNEGNSDGKPGDELTVMQNGMMNKKILETYRFDGKKWILASTKN